MEMKNILLIMLGGFGDTLQTIPTIIALKKAFPTARLSALVMYKTSKEVLERNAPLDEILYFDFLVQGYWKSLSFILQLRRKNYELSFLTYPANRFHHNLISFLIGASQRFGHRYEVRRWRSLRFLQTQLIPLEFTRHTVDENLLLLDALGARPSTISRKIPFCLTQYDTSFADRFLASYDISTSDVVIGIHPGSSILAGMIHKRWPKERFAQVADKLCEDRGARILLFGGADERELVVEIGTLMKNKPIRVIDTTIFQTAALIQRCAVFLCNDTGLMHIASALEVPTVVIVGPNNHYKTMPLHARCRVIKTQLDCQPCYKIGEDMWCKYRKGRYDCLTFIDVDRVSTAVKELIT